MRPVFSTDSRRKRQATSVVLLGMMLAAALSPAAAGASPPAAQSCPAGQTTSIEIDQRDLPVRVQGWLGQNGTLTRSLRLVACGGDVGNFDFLAYDLQPTDGSTGTTIPRQNVTLVGDDRSLAQNSLRDFQLQVSGIDAPGSYSGTFSLLVLPTTPDGSPPQERTFSLRVEAQARPALTPVAGSDQLQLQLVHCGGGLDCMLAGLVLPDSAQADTRHLHFDNTTRSPVTVTSAVVVAQGSLTGYQVSPAAVRPHTMPVTLASNAIVSLPLTLSRLDLPADRYMGSVYLTLEGAADRLRVPVDMSVRVGPSGPLLALLLGILLGVLVRYMQGRGGKLADARDRLDRVRTRVTMLDDQVERAVLDKRLNLVEQDINWGQLDRAGTALAEIELRVEELLLADLDAQRPLTTSGSSTRELFPADVLESAGGSDRVPALTAFSRAWGNFVVWFQNRWRGLVVRATQALRPLLYLALLVGLAIVGLQTFYVENGATFGAQPLADYLSLVLWGLSADVTSRTLTTLGWTGRQPPPGGGTAGGGSGGGAGGDAGGGDAGGGDAEADSRNEGERGNHSNEALQESVLEKFSQSDAPSELEGTTTMTTATEADFVYHVLLIGIDAYAQAALGGCVNDIDDIEKLLSDRTLLGPKAKMRITRLAAPRPGASTSHSQSLLPTRNNILGAFKTLADPGTVSSTDRVLVYYSGHGAQKQWNTSLTWHEALVPLDVPNFLYDVEINRLINDIAARTDDLTIIMDCCHSAGSTRGLQSPTTGNDSEVEAVAFRYYDAGGEPVAPPDGLIGDTRGGEDERILRSEDPRYVVIAACRSDELAAEQSFGNRRNGLLTRSLLTLLHSRPAEERSQLRWVDVWPQLLDEVSRSGQQTPWMIGRNERRIFGGSWERQDPGFSVTGPDPQGVYTLNAGTLMGVTEGAVLAIYGKVPTEFPPLYDERGVEDTAGQVGRVVVDENPGRSRCTARSATGRAFDLPSGARARLVRPGANERLRVGLGNPEPPVLERLNSSALLQVVPADAPEAEVYVLGSTAKGWTIGNGIEPAMATVPAGQVGLMQAGLEAYTNYNNTLRLAHRSHDPALSGALSVRIVDATHSDPIRMAGPNEIAELLANLPEAPRRSDISPITTRPYGGNYVLPEGFIFAVRIKNTHRNTLYVTLLLCTAGGKVQYVGDESVNSNDYKVLWNSGMLGEGWGASPSMGRDEATDQLVVIATTRKDVDLRYLEQNSNIQDVVDGLGALGRDIQDTKGAPAELWTAEIVPIVMTR
ncbi:MAG: caspase family protein [Chloroflexota bacterium]|nr:caspase family protein [Chloroflexota bacterium]MDQ5864523.1 caspase family protein [Chloroflexota bacterium]